MNGAASSGRALNDSLARRLLVAALLFLVTFVLYAPVRHQAFIAYDDPQYVTENPHVRHGLRADEVLWVCTHDYESNWHPLTWISHMLDVELFGLEPAGHHLVNAGLHALNAGLLFLALALLTRRRWPSLLVAALFALHPLRVESVAWVAERKDVLSGTFWMLTLLAYARFARRPTPASYGLVALGFVLGGMSKPTVVTLPLLLLLLDYWPLDRLEGGIASRAVREKLPLLLLALVLGAVTFLAQRAGDATSGLSDLPLDLRALNALAACGAYLRQTFLPFDLAVHYPHAAVTAEDPRAALLVPALVSSIVLGAISFVAYRLRRRAPAVLVGWLWMLIALLPMLGLVQVGAQAHADRYTYLPMIGAGIAIVFGMADALKARTELVRALTAAGFVGVVLLAFATQRQLTFWKDTRTLFEHALEVTERNYVAYTKLGEICQAEGDDVRAAQHFREALRIRPNSTETLTNLGVMQLQSGNLTRAQELFERVLVLDERDAAARLNLGVVHLNRAELDQARQAFERVAQTETPQRADALFNLGYLVQTAGDLPRAEERYRATLAWAPEHGAALNNLGEVLLARDDPAGAAQLFERLARLEPNEPSVHLNLGVALARAGQRERARAAFQEALTLDPSFALAREALRELEGR